MYISMTVLYIPYSSSWSRCLHGAERGHSRDGKGREGLFDSVGGFRIRSLSYLRTLPFPLASPEHNSCNDRSSYIATIRCTSIKTSELEKKVNIYSCAFMLS